MRQLVAEIVTELSLLPDRLPGHDGWVREVVVVVYERFALLDLAGPADVLRAATLLGGSPGYRVVVASGRGEPVRSDCGITVVPDASLAVLASRRREVDTVLVAGGLGVDRVGADLLADLRRVSGRARRCCSVCTGALALAAAGLLDGHRATTHWAACGQLAARFPAVEVLADRIYVRDGEVWTSAGVTAALDLALALVEDDLGSDLAHDVARWLVVFARRPGGQAQFSAALRAQPAHTPALAELQRWLPDHLAEDLSVPTLARRAKMSVRTFARTFRRETGTTPGAFVAALRVEAARRLLETSALTIQAVATAAGLGHAETLHRAFQRQVGTTPDRYRQHFARSSP